MKRRIGNVSWSAVKPQARRLALFAAAALALAAGMLPAARGQVGEPMGAATGNTFHVKITHGGNVVVDNASVPFPADIKINDCDPEDYVTIGSLGRDAPIILKVVSDGGASEDFRVTHWYVDVPNVANINLPGPTSLFDPSDSGRIKVEISDIKFANTLTAIPLLLNQNDFYVSYLRDRAGQFYETTGANAYNAYGHGILDIQVPGSQYLDMDPTNYTFTSGPGGVVSWSWNQIVNPGPTTLVHNGFSSVPSSGAGYVFELGLGIAFVGEPVPEPATWMLLGGGLLAFSVRTLRRRGRSAAPPQD